MSFERFMTDNIRVLKQSGEVIENLKASVQSTKITLMRSDVLIEPRDLIERRASNGAVETFEVIDPGFHEAVSRMQACYVMSVRKLGLPEAKERVEHITYNLGPNARINNHSVDQSSNTVNMGGDFKDQIESLRLAVQSLADAHQKQSALEIVDAVEVQLTSPNPSKTVVSTLLKALPHVASIAQVTAAIMSAL